MPLFFVVLFGSYLLGNLYIFHHLFQVLKACPPVWKAAASVLYWLGALSIVPEFFFKKYIAGETLLSLLHGIGTGWLVFTLYLAMLLLAVDILKLFNIRFIHSTISCFLLVIALLAYGYWHYRHPQVKELNVVINKPVNNGFPREMKVVAVSDIHLGYGTGKAQLAEYVRLINAQRPDLVLIGGDLIDNDIRPVVQADMHEELCRLQAPMGVYMVPGNHDYFAQIDACEAFLRKTPVRLLRDEVETLPNGVQLLGRDDKTNRRRAPLSRLVAEADPARPMLLIDHQPYHLDEAARLGIDFQFSGHTHHGQIVPLSWVTDRLFDLSYGYRRDGTTHFYVSSGLSLWGPPFRIGTDSELAVIHLKFD